MSNFIPNWPELGLIRDEWGPNWRKTRFTSDVNGIT